jgi:hypothetical protein
MTDNNSVRKNNNNSRRTVNPKVYNKRTLQNLCYQCGSKNHQALHCKSNIVASTKADKDEIGEDLKEEDSDLYTNDDNNSFEIFIEKKNNQTT